MDFLMRDGAPLNVVEWEALNRVVQDVMRNQLVGRRFLKLYGPLGAGVQVIPTDQFSGRDMGQVGMTGHDDPVALMNRIYQRVPMIHKDFVLFWRDIEAARTTGIPMDWAMAEAAASFVAQSEDNVIFHGATDQNIEGLLTISGRHTLETSGWDEVGSGFQDVVKAIRQITTSGFYPPYSVVVGTEGYAQWHRLYGQSGVLEVDQIRKLADGGVFVSPLIPEKTAIVLAAGAENIDLAVGLDTSVAFLESTNMNHNFRILETLVPRIKRPQAICVLTSSKNRNKN